MNEFEPHPSAQEATMRVRKIHLLRAAHVLGVTLVVALSAAAVVYGLLVREQGIIVSEIVHMASSDPKPVIDRVQAYKQGFLARSFAGSSLLDTGALDAILCEKQFEIQDLEAALVACTSAVESARRHSLDPSAFIYNRAMVYVAGINTWQGALTVADRDLRQTLNIGDSRLILEKIALLRKARGDTQEKRDQGNDGARSWDVDPFSDGKSQSDKFGF